MFGRILVPLDGSETAERVLPFVITEAKLHGATVSLLRVIAPLRQSLMASLSAIERAYGEIDNLAKDYLDTISSRFESEGIEVEMLVKKGAPALEIIQVAKDIGCDLIVIGSHGETGAPQWRFGGVANKVVKAKTSIPVMLIPTRE